MIHSPMLRLLVPVLALTLTPLGIAAPANEGDDVVKLPPQDDEFSRLAKAKMEYLDDTFGKGFFTYFCNDGIMPRPYLVAAEFKPSFDPETLENEYAEIFGYLYQQFFAQYGEMLETGSIEEPVVALVFDSRESYEKVFKEERAAITKALEDGTEPKLEGGRKIHGLADPEFMAGYFRPDNEILYQWRQEDLWTVMFHEGTHQLVHHATKKWNPPQASETPWFQEGIADFMGGHKRKTVYSEEKKGFVKEFTLGQFMPNRYTVLQRGIQGGEHMTLKELCYLDFWSFKGAQNDQSGNSRNQQITTMLYAQGWALVKFLNQYEGGKYRGHFHEYFKRECRGQGGGDAFADIFVLESDQDWDDLEAEWHEWIYGELRAEMPRK
jgi:hypothetical protein